MSQLLLDTHALIWFLEDDANLPILIKQKIESADAVFLSIASLWEIAIKISISKLSLKGDFEAIEPQINALGIPILPIAFADTVQIRCLPLHHRDPFDRILVAQAMNHSLVLISRDLAFDFYSIQRVW
ncbi:type II toxin-antitoxin system VapC family toxin [Merismopedia glauca]|uniref:PIN domain nuclease n=1 Tax=Merismopedia glauca CCAP 1448/3 TaxID=1296344 RepID=A0A2T1C9D7_9CYAN|nr:type II toxin-antitoxin system VapC family toxin [Merismopedia glauca]PSB04753.1 PIN domain nuclease [Merismopedia glauca CCAP 1448/3]